MSNKERLCLYLASVRDQCRRLVAEHYALCRRGRDINAADVTDDNMRVLTAAFERRAIEAQQAGRSPNFTPVQMRFLALYVAYRESDAAIELASSLCDAPGDTAAASAPAGAKKAAAKKAPAGKRAAGAGRGAAAGRAGGAAAKPADKPAGKGAAAKRVSAAARQKKQPQEAKEGAEAEAAASSAAAE